MNVSQVFSLSSSTSEGCEKGLPGTEDTSDEFNSRYFFLLWLWDNLFILATVFDYAF